jgi:hypothetical protein
MKDVFCYIRFIILFTILVSCSSPQEEKVNRSSDKLISKQEFDSVLQRTGYIEERKNISATLDNDKWTSNSFTVNTFMVKGKKLFSIYATDGNSQLTINYSGPQAPGIINTGEDVVAVYRTNDGALYNCTNGFVEITQIDTVTKKISGRFRLYCKSNKDKSQQRNFDEGTFTDLTWN